MVRLGDVSPTDPPASRDGLAGALLDGRYRFEALLGRGGTGAVYRALDLRLDRPVAVKVLDATEVPDGAGGAGERRVAAEVRTLARFSHPNLVRLLDAGELDGRSCLVMDLVDGPTLARLLAAGPLRQQVAARVGVEIASALEYVHGEGIVHRDVKPANVLIGSDGVARLADFGIARLVDTTGLTATGYVLGTPAYLAPEQVQGEVVGQEVDIYSLGLVLLECLSGRRAFEGTLAELTAARLHRDPPVPSDVGPRWSELLGAMTARDPAERPRAAVVADRLAAMQEPGRARTSAPTRGVPGGALAVAEPADAAATTVTVATAGAAATTATAAGAATAAAAAVGGERAADGPTLAIALAGAASGDVTRDVVTSSRRRRLVALVGLVALAGVAVGLAETLPGTPADRARSGTLTRSVKGRATTVVPPATTVRSSTTSTTHPTTTSTTTTSTTTSTTTTTTTTTPVSPLVAAETGVTSILASGVRAGTVVPGAARQLDAALQGIGAATGSSGPSSATTAFDQVVGTFYADVEAGSVVGSPTVDAVLRGLSTLASALGTSLPPPSAYAGSGAPPGASSPVGPGNGNGNGNGPGQGKGNGH